MSLTGLLIVTVGVALLAIRLAAAGMRRVLSGTMETRRAAVDGTSSWWRLLPLVTGPSVFVAFLLRTIGKHGFSACGQKTTVLGTGLATIGVVIALRPMVSSTAAQLARRATSVSVRLDVRRLQYEPSSVIRVVAGLVVLVLVAAIGAGVLRDAALAASPRASTLSDALTPANFHRPAGLTRPQTAQANGPDVNVVGSRLRHHVLDAATSSTATARAPARARGPLTYRSCGGRSFAQRPEERTPVRLGLTHGRPVRTGASGPQPGFRHDRHERRRDTADQPTAVWVLEPTAYDHYGIKGVYESVEAAKWHWPDDTWRLDRHGDWVAGDEDLPMDQDGIRLYADTVKKAQGRRDSAWIHRCHS